MYKDAGKKLKSLIHMVTIVGYAIADIIGLFAGIRVGAIMGALDLGVLIQVLSGILVAAVVAAVLMFMVWIANVVLWIYADMSENIKQIKEEIAKNN